MREKLRQILGIEIDALHDQVSRGIRLTKDEALKLATLVRAAADLEEEAQAEAAGADSDVDDLLEQAR